MTKHICQDEHIAYLLESAITLHQRWVDNPEIPFFWKNEWGERRELTRENFRETGQMLKDQNFLAWREERTDQDPRQHPRPIFQVTGAEIWPWVRLEAVEVIRSAHGYTLNSQGENWKGSSARRFIKKLIQTATGQLPGYDRASLGAPDRLERIMALKRDG